MPPRKSTAAARAIRSKDTATTVTTSKSAAVPSDSALVTLVDQLQSLKATGNTKDATLKAAKSAFTFLSSFKQQPPELSSSDRALLKSVSKSLLNRSLMHSKDIEVRLLTGCALADTLRIWAPNPPFDPNEIKVIFTLLEDCLAALTEPKGAQYDKCYYLLESLALVRTPILLVSLQSHEPLLAFMHKLMDVANTDTTLDQCEANIVEILYGLLDELQSDEIDQTIVDMLLSPMADIDFTAVNIHDKPTLPLTARIVIATIERCKEKLERAICRFVQKAVIAPSLKEEHAKKGSEKSDGEDKPHHRSKRKAKHVEDESDDDAEMDEGDEFSTLLTAKSALDTIFKSLHLFLPDLLLTLSSDLSDVLLLGSDQRRRDFTRIYSEIFCALPELVNKFHTVYESLTQRFLDVSSEVRVTIATSSGNILISVYGGSTHIVGSASDSNEREDGTTSGVNLGTHAVTLEKFWSLLSVGVNDRDDQVRLATVKSLCFACEKIASLVGLSLLAELGKRCKDKRIDVRKSCVTGLARCFHAHLTPHWRRGVSVPQHLRRLQFIPAKLLEALELDQSSSLKVQTLLAFDHLIIGVKDNEVNEQDVEERTRCAVAIFVTLDDAPSTALTWAEGQAGNTKEFFRRHLIANRAGMHTAIRNCLDASAKLVTLKSRRHSKANGGVDDTDIDLVAALRNRALSLRTMAAHLCFEEDAASFANNRDDAVKFIESILDTIFKSSDDRVEQALLRIIDSRATLADIRKAQRELKVVVKELKFDSQSLSTPSSRKSKSTVLAPAEVTDRLAVLCSQTILPANAVPHLFSEATTNLELRRMPMAQAALELLVALAQSFPSMLADSIDQVQSLLTSSQSITTNKKSLTDKQTPEQSPHSNTSITVSALRILSSVDWQSETTAIKSATLTKFESTLLSIATTLNDEHEVRFAIRAIKALLTPREETNRRTNVNLHSDTLESRADKLLTKLFDELFKRLSLSTPQHALHLTLVGLAEIGSAYPKLIEQRREALMDFIEKELFMSAIPSHSGAVTASIELLTRWLIAIAQSDESMEQQARRASIIIRLFLDHIRRNGKINPNLVTSHTDNDSDSEEMADRPLDIDDDSAKLDPQSPLAVQRFEASVVRALSISMLDLCRIPHYHRLLFTFREAQGRKHNFHFATLAVVAEHSDRRVSEAFVEKAFHDMQEVLPLSPYLTILCLAHPHASEDFQRRIDSWIRRLCQRSRSRVTQSESLTQSSTDEDSTTGTDTVRRPRVNPKLPENVLADLIYVLSYHPGFVDPTEFKSPASLTPSDIEHAFALYNTFLRYIEVFIDAVTDVKGDGNNWSLLLAVCTTVKNSEDVRDASNERIYKLADLVQLIVHRRSQRKHWGQHITSVVQLPTHMFRARTTKPKERYLHKSYHLPPESTHHHGHGHGHGSAPDTPKAAAGSKRRALDMDSPAPAANHASPKASTPKRRKSTKSEKPDKLTSPPSRSMPSRVAKSLVSSYTEKLDEEDDEQVSE